MRISAYRCPNCQHSLRRFAIGSRGYRFSCPDCQLEYSTKTLTDEADAYVDLLEKYESGELSNESSAQIESDSDGALVQNEDQTLIEDLPTGVRRLLSARTDRLIRFRRIPAQRGEYGKAVEDSGLKSGFIKALKSMGIKRLYQFQEQAIKEALSGNNLVISAPTGSGKTEAFTLPILESIASSGIRFGPILASRRKVAALFIYPTKALNRDQLPKLKRLGVHEGITADVFDGDTPRSKREQILRNPPDILITDFDTVDYHLRLRDAFSHLIEEIKFLVVDELHQYVGAFGSHVYFLTARLRRVCPPFQILAASATLPNALEFAEKLFNCEMGLIQAEKVTRGPIHFLMMYPRHRSFRTMMTELASTCMIQGYKTLVFANTHIDAELISVIARQKGVNIGIHRAGLSPTHRMNTEAAFKSGSIRGLVSTPTLELGIDIGDLDAVVSMLTDITRLTQRLGRAGRKGQESVAILALRDNDPISTYYTNNPDQYFTDIASGYVEPKNEIVAGYELTSAALDRPLKESEFTDFKSVISQLSTEGILDQRKGRLYPTRQAWRYLANRNLRNIGQPVSIMHQGRKIGERQMPMAASELFPGAIYLHGGRRYSSRAFFLGPRGGRADVDIASDANPFRTRPLSTIKPEIVELIEVTEAVSAELVYAKLRITEEIFGYLLLDLFRDKIVESRRLDTLIHFQYETRGLAFRAPEPKDNSYDLTTRATKDHDFEEELVELLAGRDNAVRSDDLAGMISGGSYHALEHVLIEGSDMLVGGGRNEIGGVSLGDTGTIFIYDGTPGGSGISKLLFGRFEEAIRRSLAILTECHCRQLDGCPMCTYSYRCGNNNAPLIKQGARESAQRLVDGEETHLDLAATSDERAFR